MEGRQHSERVYGHPSQQLLVFLPLNRFERGWYVKMCRKDTGSTYRWMLHVWFDLHRIRCGICWRPGFKSLSCCCFSIFRVKFNQGERLIIVTSDKYIRLFNTQDVITTLAVLTNGTSANFCESTLGKFPFAKMGASSMPCIGSATCTRNDQ